jgi:hypothetical protein
MTLEDLIEVLIQARLECLVNELTERYQQENENMKYGGKFFCLRVGWMVRWFLRRFWHMFYQVICGRLTLSAF